MPGQSGEKVVCDLQVQATVDELNLGGADYVYGGAQLTGGERFEGTQVRSGPCEVG